MCVCVNLIWFSRLKAKSWWRLTLPWSKQREEREAEGCLQSCTERDLPWHPSLESIYNHRCSLFPHMGHCASSHPVRHKADNIRAFCSSEQKFHITAACSCLPHLQWSVFMCNGTQPGGELLVWTAVLVSSAVHKCLSVASERLIVTPPSAHLLVWSGERMFWCGSNESWRYRRNFGLLWC